MRPDALAGSMEDCQAVTDPTSGLLAEFMTASRLAVELGVSERTIHRWHTARLGPPRVVIGRVVLYKRSSVISWLQSREESQARGRKGRR